MTGCLVVDTYAWVAYLEGNQAYKEPLENNDLKTPSIAIAELARIFARRGINRTEARRLIGNVAQRSLIMDLGYEQAVICGEIAEREKLALADAIIYSYASSAENLITGDEHFRGKKNVILIK